MTKLLLLLCLSLLDDFGSEVGIGIEVRACKVEQVGRLNRRHFQDEMVIIDIVKIRDLVAANRSDGVLGEPMVDGQFPEIGFMSVEDLDGGCTIRRPNTTILAEAQPALELYSPALRVSGCASGDISV